MSMFVSVDLWSCMFVPLPCNFFELFTPVGECNDLVTFKFIKVLTFVYQLLCNFRAHGVIGEKYK